MSTESEAAFAFFCEHHGIACHRIPEAEEPRPDYEIVLSGQLVLVEVKQFDANADELKAQAARERGDLGVLLGTTPGSRIRNAIDKANVQLKRLLAGRALPTMLVVYNNSPSRFHTDAYAVMTAMQGFDVIDVEVQPDTDKPLRFGEPRSGHSRMMSPNANTSTSALAVLSPTFMDEPTLVVYHNRHAACRLDPNLLRIPEIVFHVRIPDGATNSIDTKWEAI